MVGSFLGGFRLGSEWALGLVLRLATERRLLAERRLGYLGWLLVELLLLTDLLHLVLGVLHDWLWLSVLGLVRSLKLGLLELRRRLCESWLLMYHLLVLHHYVVRLPLLSLDWSFILIFGPLLDLVIGARNELVSQV